MKGPFVIPWPRIVAEAVAIVVSILLAFAIQAWWENRGERIAELQYLQSLHDDFSATRDQLNARIDYIGNRFESIEQVFDIVSQRSGEPDADEISALIGRVYGITGMTTVTHTYQDIVSSGNLRLIRDRELRGAMAELVELLSDIDTITDRIADTYWTHHANFVDRHLVTTDFQWWEDGTAGPEAMQILSSAPQSPFDINVDALYSREFWNLMFDWKVAYADQLLPTITARDQCGEVLAMLEQAIESAR